MHSTEIHLKEKSKKYHMHAFFIRMVSFCFMMDIRKFLAHFMLILIKKRRVFNLIAHLCFLSLRNFCYFISINCLQLVECIIRNSSLSLLEVVKWRVKTKGSILFFKISIALMALRIRKNLFHHIFCSHPVWPTTSN